MWPGASGRKERFLAHFPHAVHTILTDNGAEFTDRFAVDMKNKPKDRPSGRHPFDRICAKQRIHHRLIRPYHPQTNGLLERFNRRIVDAIGREPKRGSARRLFRSHQDRDAFLNRFVEDYNRTRLKCLDYRAPLEAVHALSNLPGPNTNAGTHNHRRRLVRKAFTSLPEREHTAYGSRLALRLAGTTWHIFVIHSHKTDSPITVIASVSEDSMGGG